jgi:hypothetical protein
MCNIRHSIAITLLCLAPGSAVAADALNILQFAPPGGVVDRTGHEDASPALSAAVKAANVFTARGEPACVYIPPGIYRIVRSPPEFVRAGCVKGDGPTQSVLRIDKTFQGDLFAWSEAWLPTTPGPTVVGLKIEGDVTATNDQNALVFYDRNDEVFLDNIEVDGLHGRALYSGAKQRSSQAYMREAHIRSLRFFRDGALGVPVVEFSSEGSGKTDASNEIAMNQVDIYGAAGPSLVIRNGGNGSMRSITIDSLRIEGLESGQSRGDLLAIGDTVMPGKVNNIRLTNVELLDVAAGFSALHVTAAPGTPPPYQLTFDGAIGGGIPRGEGLRIDAGRDSVFRFSAMHTMGANVVIGRGVTGILLDGGGRERSWTFRIDPRDASSILFPVFRGPGN